MVDGRDRNPRRSMLIDALSIVLDRLHDVRDRTHALVRNGRIKRGKIDRSHRLGAEHERVVMHALAIDLCLQRQIAQAFETCLRLFLDAAVEKVDGGQIA